MRIRIAAAATFLAVVSCSGPASPPAPPSTPGSGPEATAAPDFTLALGAGGTFTLSAEARPVFMVFWAEW